MTTGPYPMPADSVLGDGGNVTVYQRPDGSRYALDKKGNGREWKAGEAIFGRARFDARPLASGQWPGSRSTLQANGDDAGDRRARRHPGASSGAPW